MTSNVTIDSAIYQQQQTNATLGKLADDFSQFLTLLTTQLQNQDPLDPMDTHQFTSQLVQFSQVEQQINSNKKLDSLVQMQLANSFGMSLGYVGLDINYVSGEFNYDGATPVEMKYALPESAEESRIFILDEKGQIVYSEEAEKGAGAHDFVWDGRSDGGKPMEPGTYSIRLDASNVEGDMMDTTTLVSGRVSGVETQNGTLFLIVGERAVPLSNVLKAAEPAAPLVEEEDETAADTTETSDTTTETDETTEEETV